MKSELRFSIPLAISCSIPLRRLTIVSRNAPCLTYSAIFTPAFFDRSRRSEYSASFSLIVTTWVRFSSVGLEGRPPFLTVGLLIVDFVVVYVDWGGKERLMLRSFGNRFRRKRNPETYPCLPNSLRSSGSCPTVYRVQWYPDIIISELTPYFDVIGIEIQMLDKNGVDVAADACIAVTEDTGDAFELLPHAVLDVNGVTLHQL